MLGRLFTFLIVCVWGYWAYFISKIVHKTLERDLRYLLEPKVRILETHEAGARYDQVNLRKWEIYFGAIFLIPIRIIFSIPIFAYGECGRIVIWKIFGGKKLNKNKLMSKI